MTYGPAIPVNGKKPDWLGDDEYYELQNQMGAWFIGPHNSSWANITAIRLPADHPYYTVQRWNKAHPDAAPFEYCNSKPDDWDKSTVLLADGNEWRSWPDWDLDRHNPRRVIGYRRKPKAPTCHPERLAAIEAPALPMYDPATHVVVERMTEEE